MAVVGTFAAVSDPGLAQPTVSPIQVVSQPPAGTPSWPAGALNTAPRISDDGTVVVFDSMTPGDPTTAQVMVRDRTAGTTTAVTDRPSMHPGLSGNGCVVAYSVPMVATSKIQLIAVDRCTASGTVGPTSVQVGLIDDPGTVDGALPAPALSADGRVILWSTGTSVLRYVDPGTGYALADTITPPPTTPVPATSVPGPPAVLVTGPVVDVSGDGKVVVFVAGPGTAPYGPVPANVFVWTAGGVGPPATGPTVQLLSATSLGQAIAGSSTAPSISADSRIVTYQSDNTTLAVPGVGSATAPFVVVVDRLGASRVLASGASRPAVSSDGSTIVYDTATDVHRARSVGTTPFATVTSVSLSTAAGSTSPTGPSVSGAALSGSGSIGVFDSTAGAALMADPAFPAGTQVFARVIDDAPPPTTTAPQSTAVPSTPATTTPATTVRPTTTTAAPLPSTTVPVTSVATRPVTPTTSPPYRPPSVGSSGRSGGSSSSSSSRPVGSSTVTYQSSEPIEAATFVPMGVDFSPTIVGAGRQATTLSLSNPTSRSLDVVDVSIQNDPDAAYSIIDSTCDDGPVPSGGACTVTVAFAPVTLGASAATLVATLGDGSSTTGLLGGSGAPPPILAVIPGVASSGQVVAIQGSGFPAGLTVDLTWLDSATSELIQTDATGSFVVTMIVLPHTPRGPGTAVVAGQIDQFSTVVGDVLITDTSDRSSPVRSPGSPFGS